MYLSCVFFSSLFARMSVVSSCMYHTPLSSPLFPVPVHCSSFRSSPALLPAGLCSYSDPCLKAATRKSEISESCSLLAVVFEGSTPPSWVKAILGWCHFLLFCNRGKLKNVQVKMCVQRCEFWRAISLADWIADWKLHPGIKRKLYPGTASSGYRRFDTINPSHARVNQKIS